MPPRRRPRDPPSVPPRYRAGAFEKAVVEYTRCMAMCSRPDGHFALKVKNNRAAAYKQLGNHAAVAEDCTDVLRTWPENVKALLRRAEALEACEDYEGALEDVDAVLKIRATTRGEHDVGDKNAAKCARDRSRLARAVRELENDATGEGKRRLAARRRKAEAARKGASRVETEAQAAIRARAEQDAAAFAVDFEDTRCVVRGCGAPKHGDRGGATRRLMWCDPCFRRARESSVPVVVAAEGPGRRRARFLGDVSTARRRRARAAASARTRPTAVDGPGHQTGI